MKVLVGLGIPEQAICAIVRDRRDKPITTNTLRKHFAKELETGAAELNAMVGNLLVATIPGVEPSAGVKQITDEKIRGSLLDLFARSRLGWSTTARNEIANAEGKPFVYGNRNPRFLDAVPHPVKCDLTRCQGRWTAASGRTGR